MSETGSPPSLDYESPRSPTRQRVGPIYAALACNALAIAFGSWYASILGDAFSSQRSENWNLLLAVFGAPIALGIFGYQIYFSTGALWGRQIRGSLRYVWALALATTIIPALLPICVLLRVCWLG